MQSFIEKKCLLSPYYELGTVLGTDGRVVIKSGGRALMEVAFLHECGKREKKQKIIIKKNKQMDI